MTEPRTKSGAPKPRRAEPLQPDLPGRGDAPQTDADSGSADAQEQAKRQRQQNDDALTNVRDGYGGPGN